MADDIVMLPFCYEVKGVLRGKHKATSHWLLDHLPVRIPSISAGEAPVVARLNGGKGFASIVRCRNDRAVTPLKYGIEPLDVLRLNQAIWVMNGGDDWMAGRMDFADYPLPFARDEYGYPIRPDSPEELMFRRVEFDTRDRALAMAKEAADHLVFIDGILHGDLGEPVWTVTSPHGTYVILTVEHKRSTVHDATFRIDREADARAFASEYAERLGCGKGAVEIVLGYEVALDVADDGPWVFDDVQASLLAICQAVTYQTLSHPGHTIAQGIDFLAPMCALRDMARAKDCPAESVLENIEHMVTALEADGAPSKATPFHYHLHAFLRTALGRHRRLQLQDTFAQVDPSDAEAMNLSL